MSQDFRRYSYSWSRKMISFLTVILLTAIILFIIAGVIYSLFTLPPNIEPSDMLLLILLPVLMILFMSFFIIQLANLEPDIQILEEGLKVQFFWFWWIFVPWEDIEEIKVPLFGLSQSYLIIVHKLTFIHRIIGAMAGLFFRPAFLISSKLNRHNELVKIIKNKTSKDMF